MAKVKITVIKKANLKDLYGETPPAEFNRDMITLECTKFKLGEQFIMDSLNCPPEFCNWAFSDIQRDLVHILFGGSYPWIKEQGVAISCCTDGLRPVIFRIERLED